MTTPPRRARVWATIDFARHLYGTPSPSRAQHLRARRMLRRLNAKHGGQLLTPSEGTNRGYTLCPSVLARLEPDLFTPVESLEFRIEELEDVADRQTEQIQALALRTTEHGREIARLRNRPTAA